MSEAVAKKVLLSYLVDVYDDTAELHKKMKIRLRDLDNVEFAETGFVRELMKSRAEALNKTKELLKKEIMKIAKDFPLYNRWCAYVHGFSPLFFGYFMRYIDFDKAKHVSSLYSYAGLVVDDKTGLAAKRGIKYNPKFKSFLYTVGTSFERRGRGYRKIYEEFKAEEMSKAKIIVKVKELDKYKGYYLGDKVLNSKIIEKIKREEKGFVEVRRSYAHIRMRTLRKLEKVFLAHMFIVHKWLSEKKVEVHYQGLKDGWTYMPVIDVPKILLEGDDRFAWWFELKDAYVDEGIKPIPVFYEARQSNSDHSYNVKEQIGGEVDE